MAFPLWVTSGRLLPISGGEHCSQKKGAEAELTSSKHFQVPLCS